MAYRFKDHKKRFVEALLGHFPLLFAIHLPEGLLTLVQYFFESTFTQSPKTAFVFLYPLLCFSAIICSALSFLIVRSPETRKVNLYVLWKELQPHLAKLGLGSLALGLIMIPATLALLIPGLYVLTIYLFIPFLILEDAELKLSSCFYQSKVLAKEHIEICGLTALASFVISILPLLGLSLLDSPLFDSTLGIALETVFGMVLSVLMNTWLSTLFLEVSKK
jgi:hypothetical protein